MVMINLTGSAMIVSSNSLISMWVGIEIISLSLPPILSSMNSSIMSKINAWKYFMIQCYSSILFLTSTFCTSLSSTSSIYSNIFWMIMFFSLILKMGIFPLHGWNFHLSTNLSWSHFLILSTIQKIGPLIILSEFYGEMNFQMDIMLSSTLSMLSLSMIFINSTRNFILTSSMINSMWIISSSQVSKLSFIFFMLFYFAHLVLIFHFFKSDFSLLPFSLSMNSKESFSMETTKLMIIMSLIGMPPTGGFIMKISIIEQLSQSMNFTSTILLTLSSSVLMMAYFKIFIMMMNSTRSKLNQLKINYLGYFSMIFISMGTYLFFV